MEKVITIVKKGEDKENFKYALSLTPSERLDELEKIRQEVIREKYGNIEQRFERVFRIVKKK